MGNALSALILTNEYPPNVYGGAGVHVEYLTRELAKLIDVDVRTFGAQDAREGSLQVRGFPVAHDLSASPQQLRPVLAAFSRSIGFVAEPVSADVVHCHTWYAHLGGILAKLAYGIPLVITVHSLEPLRPWKREQLGGGYDASSWVERTALEMADAVIAVSQGTKDDVLANFDVPEERIAIIHNGIDTDEYRAQEATDALERHGVDPAVPYVLFVGRITRQKGIVHLVRAIRHLDAGDRGRALRRRARHAGDRRRDGGGRARGTGASIRTSTGSPRWSTSRRSASSIRTQPCLPAHRSTSRSGSSTSRRWRARRRSSPAPWAGSRKSSSMARRACWCRSSPRAAGPSSLVIRMPSSATWRRGSTS